MPAPTYPCDGPNCPNSVRKRKNSTTGRHFCAAAPCQAAKQAFYRQQKSGEVKTQVRDGELEELKEKVAKYKASTEATAYLLQAIRDGLPVECPKCHRPDARDHFPHPAPGVADICDGTNASQGRVIAPLILWQVWPEG